MNKLTHMSSEDNRPEMVDVSSKPDQYRVAEASGTIKLKPDTLVLITENRIKKGNVLVTAELAGTMGAKRTPDLIPLCHSLNTTKIMVKCRVSEKGIDVLSRVSCIGKTGVEMEALTAVSVALLTVYDMCKAVDKTMEISEVKLLSKRKENIIP